MEAISLVAMELAGIHLHKGEKKMNKKILIGILVCLVLIGGLVVAKDMVDRKEKKDKYDSYDEALDYEEYALTNMKYEAKIIDMERDIHDTEITVIWHVQLYAEEFYDEEECTYDEETMEENCQIVTKVARDILHDETFSSTVPEDATDKEIEDTIKLHARDWINSWRPPLKVGIDNKLIGASLDLTG